MRTNEQELEIPLPEGHNIGFSYQSLQDWKDYDLQTHAVSFQGVPTSLQAIIYKGQFIAFRSKNYKVFPHEDIFATLDPIMGELGMKNEARHLNKSNTFSLAYGKNKAAKVEASATFFNGKKVYNGSKLTASYTFGNKFDVTGDGDYVNFGATISNALDGTMSLRISPFSLRQVCSNGMMHNATVVEIAESILQKMRNKNEASTNELITEHVSKIMDEAKSFDDLIGKLKQERMSHVTKIPVEWITSRVYLIKESVTLFKQRYREMTKLYMTQKKAEEIAAIMPKRLLDSLEWLDIKKQEVDTPNGPQVQQIVSLKGKPTQWKAFNDMTENLTHTERAFNAKTWSYRQVDKILVMSK